MRLVSRNTFPLVLAALGVAGFIWSISFTPLPPADFSFDNGNEVQTLDPARASGVPEHRIISSLFEGLLRTMPEADWQTKYKPTDNVPMSPQPGMAHLPQISDDGLTYTFKLFPDRQWSDGSPVTAHDFAWSWQRTLHPEMASKYAYQLYYVKGAQAYNTTVLESGDDVEVELADRPNELQLFPRGTIVRGKLQQIHKLPEPAIPPDASNEQKEDRIAQWMQGWVYAVALPDGSSRMYCAKPSSAPPPLKDKVTRCLYILPDFEKTVGVRVEDDHTLVVTLNSPTPYFNELVAFYTLFPVHRASVEKYGTPDWTKPGHLVSNGAYSLELRRLRDRIRLAKNERYWDAANIKLATIDAFAVKSETTSLNLYMNNQVDWATVMPVAMIPKIKEDMPTQFRSAPELTVYFYRVNVTRPGLDNPKVRKALNLAIDKQNICDIVTRAGEVPAGTFVPPGLAGYNSPPGYAYNVEEAKRLLAEAGHPFGRGLPPVEILYNDLDVHRTIAERIQQMWRDNLGIDVQLRGLEWGVYLTSQEQLDYGVCRAGWVADYPDPNTFLDMFTSDNPQNQTGWKNKQYDKLIENAAIESDPAKRLALLSDAEAILLDELPLLPMYFYVSKNLVKPHVKGFFNNVQNLHPLMFLEVDRSDAARASEPKLVAGAGPTGSPGVWRGAIELPSDKPAALAALPGLREYAPAPATRATTLSAQLQESQP